MVKMPWNRNRTRPSSAPNVPAEVEEYYQSTYKERRGVAWLLALAALLLTLLIAAGLFFGGRWLYRTLFNNNDQPAETTQQEGAPAEQTPAEPAAPEQGSGDNQNQSLPGDTQPESTQNNTNNPNNSTGGATTTPTTGPETPEIPRTGPTEE